MFSFGVKRAGYNSEIEHLAQNNLSNVSYEARLLTPPGTFFAGGEVLEGHSPLRSGAVAGDEQTRGCREDQARRTMMKSKYPSASRLF